MQANKSLITSIKKGIFLTVGVISLIVGIIGIFLPLLPTTCFLLLTAICFERGSDKFHDWLMSHPYFGPPIIDWQKNKVIRLKYKALATTTMAIGAYFVYAKPIVPVFVVVGYSAFMFALLAFIWTRKSLPTIVARTTQ
ncbi:MAG: YbaN family protein [Bdellovibrionota bacterium]